MRGQTDIHCRAHGQVKVKGMEVSSFTTGYLGMYNSLSFSLCIKSSSWVRNVGV